MTTLLSVGNGEGTRRCDARCHEATSASCACICGGRYHGKGSATALELIAADARAGIGPAGAAAVRVLRAKQEALAL